MGTNKITFFYFIYLTEAYLSSGQLSTSITRHHKGDIFTAQGEKCYSELCIGHREEKSTTNENKECECKCGQNMPVYRDDLNICVDDIQECTLVPFVSGAVSKRIPYVFLPLKGQIVNPSADIVASENGTPVCVVSGGQFLGRNGWLNLRNNTNTEPPFRLFRDEGRTYLQWFGESSMRMAMEGKIILVHLMCKDASIAEEPKIFTPCVAFRVAGNPNAREVMFAPDVRSESNTGGLSVREYVAIGLCSLFLAIVYVASIIFYMHRRAKKEKKTNLRKRADAHITLGEEGIIKNNPLLQASRHLGVCTEDNVGYITDSNSCSSDPDQVSDLLCLDEDLSSHQNVQTSAIIHPCNLDYGETLLNQDPNSIERLPEENVSIIETLEAKEAHSETMKAIASSNGRRKLYFNPTYFEPELLKAPPPAALEFLEKIREVIAIAKHKMSIKKFSPSLLGIPEEDVSFKTENNNLHRSISSFNENIINSDFKKPINETENVDLMNCNFNSTRDNSCSSDSKQKIIQKWLEDVPIMVLKKDENTRNATQSSIKTIENNKNLNKSNYCFGDALNNQTSKETQTIKQNKKRPSTKNRPPPLPPQTSKTFSNKTNISSNIEKVKCQNKNENAIQNFNTARDQEIGSLPSTEHPPCPPPLPLLKIKQNENVNFKNNIAQSNAPKNLMDAVIQELTTYKKNDKNSKFVQLQGTNQSSHAEVDDYYCIKKKNDEKIGIDLDNDTINNKNLIQISEAKDNIKNSMSGRVQDDHEYEIILLNPDSKSMDEENSEKPKTISQEILMKNEKNEGYSFVSEVYVNDDFGFCSAEFSPNSCSPLSNKSEKIKYEVVNEKQGRLTIQVKDSSNLYNEFISESDNFEPDTLERKQRKSKLMQKIDGNEDQKELYANRKFHNIELNSKSETSNNDENFTDSLERPTIMLKTTGSFERNTLEKDVNELFRSLNWARMENFGSLREIYEAKSKNHKRRTETTSLIDSVNSDPDCISTLSWGEERRNKLLHRGIILHIDDDFCARRKDRFLKKKSISTKSLLSDKAPSRPPKPMPVPRSRSVSPTSRSQTKSPTCKTINFLSLTQTMNQQQNKELDIPPIPPPRSLPVSPELTQYHERSKTSSPANFFNSTHNTVSRIHCKENCGSSCHITNSFVTSDSCPLLSLSPLPPRPPKLLVCNSPPLPPRNSKPPLPPKNSKSNKNKSNLSKLATRPLPPLPVIHQSHQNLSSFSCKELDNLSTVSGASTDSLNSSEYESFYTMPYEENTNNKEDGLRLKNLNDSAQSPDTLINVISNDSFQNCSKIDAQKTASQQQSQRIFNSDKKLEKEKNRALNRLDDSGYLSTDSSESYCPQGVLTPCNSKTVGKTENYGGQNSETEDSLCDGASESGAESTATDSFFYGNFKKINDTNLNDEQNSQNYLYSLKLSDVEVNSDTEKHCMPIMVRP